MLRMLYSGWPHSEYCSFWFDAYANNLKYVLCFVVLDFGFGGTAGASQTGVGGLGGLTGGLTAGQPSVDATAAAIAQQNQQQLLQLTSSPYGDSPLFRNLRQVSQFHAYDFFLYFKRCMYHNGYIDLKH